MAALASLSLGPAAFGCCGRSSAASRAEDQTRCAQGVNRRRPEARSRTNAAAKSPATRRDIILGSSSFLIGAGTPIPGLSGRFSEASSRPLRALASLSPADGGGDLLVVGAGVLGTLVGQLWKEKFPSSQVYGQTRTDSRHKELEALGIKPVTSPPSADSAGDAGGKIVFPYVIFCAPPSGSDDYAGAVRAATESWSKDGSFLFTSSSALYDVSDNGPCTDAACPSVPKGRGPRTDLLLSAEAAAFAVDGNVVRLAGLYTKERGAHTFWLRKGTVDSRPDHILNLIHYEDAASLCVAILSARTRGQLFMGCDNSPVSREELMDVTVRSGQFEGSFEGFTGDTGPLGKRMSNEKTRELLSWSPKYHSFADFLGVSSKI